jgi:phosphatidate cytidylyltransferase
VTVTKPERKAGRNLPVAITVGLALLSIILVSLFFNRAWFAVLVALAVVIAIWEWTHQVVVSHRNWATALLSFAAIGIFYTAWNEGIAGMSVALAVSFVVIAVARLTFGVEHYSRDIAALMLGLTYLAFLAGFVVLMAVPQDGLARVFTFVLCIAANDTGAYVTGVLFGRHRMAPGISPKKTWEGLIGGFVLAVILGVITMTLLMDSAWWTGVILGLLMAATSTLGDLVESAIKRDIGIKDMGTFLPGHGGMVDRIDALLLSAPIGWMALSILVPA